MTTLASAEPTEAEVQFAHTFLDRLDSMADDEIVTDIARALAAQRAEIVARYEAAINDLPGVLLRAARHDASIRPHSFDDEGISEVVGRYDAIAELFALRIREAAQK